MAQNHTQENDRVDFESHEGSKITRLFCLAWNVNGFGIAVYCGVTSLMGNGE